VEDPVALARFVLQDDPAWTERILEAMGQGKSHTIRLPQPIPVVMAYSTAIVKNGGPFLCRHLRPGQVARPALRRNAQHGARPAERYLDP
jgi:hypothetical protein